MAGLAKTPATKGDLVTFKVGGRWVLAEVSGTDPKGFVQQATNHAGLDLQMDNRVLRYIFPARKVGGAERVAEIVKGLWDRSFGTTEEAVEEIQTWIKQAPEEDVGEQILEVLT